MRDKTTEDVNKKDDIANTQNTEYRQVSQAPRRGKSIEQTKQENGDILVKEIRRKPPKRTESDTKLGKAERKNLQNENGSQITKQQSNKDSTRINSSEQNTKPRNDNLRKPENKNNEHKKDLKDNISQNRHIAKNQQDGKEKFLTVVQDFDQIKIDSKDNKITLNIEPKIIEKVKDKSDQNNVEKSKKVQASNHQQ